MYRRCGQGAAEHAAAASEVVLAMPLFSHQSSATTCGQRAGSEQRAVGRAGDAESQCSSAFPTGLAGPHQGAASSQEPKDRCRKTAGNKKTRLVEGSGTKEPAGGHAVVLGRRNYGQVKWCLSGQPFFFFFGVYRLAISLYYVKRTSQARGTGDRTGTGTGTAARKDCRGPVRCMWSLNNKTRCLLSRYPCAGVA